MILIVVTVGIIICEDVWSFDGENRQQLLDRAGGRGVETIRGGVRKRLTERKEKTEKDRRHGVGDLVKGAVNCHNGFD